MPYWPNPDPFSGIPAVSPLTATTIPELPQDIIDTIIQTLARLISYDKKQLQVFALVSRAFVPQYQRCIFRTIALLRDGSRSFEPPYHPLGKEIHVLGKRLSILLSTSAHVFTYIRTLKLYAWSSTEHAWVARSPEAAASIHACTGLQTLELGSEAVVNWSDMHPSMQSALVYRIQSAQLADLTLINVKQLPCALFPAFGSLRALRLEKVTSDNTPGSAHGPALQKRSQSSLKSLSISESNTALRLLLDREVISSELLILDIGYGYNGEDTSLICDLLHEIRGIRELHVILISNALDGLNSMDVNWLQSLPLRRISVLTIPDILRETYTLLQLVLAASSTLETAKVMVPLNPGHMRCLNDIRLWDDFRPDPPFRQLTLSFFLPQRDDSQGMNYESCSDEFRKIMSAAVQGRRQLLSLLGQRRMLIVYDNVERDVLWGECLDIRRRAIANPTGRVHWHTWAPFFGLEIYWISIECRDYGPKISQSKRLRSAVNLFRKLGYR